MPRRQSTIRAVRSALLLILGLIVSAAVMPQWAVAGTEIVTDAAPPADRVEHAPPPRDGYIWGAGHWEWNGRSYIWASGTWIPERRAAHWVIDRWEQVGAHWHYVAGHWER
jgi:WXXGXW repeat (2 copies)